MYDVSKYTDDELYNILDLVNPSDRELEAKLNYLITKYTNIQNESGNQLAEFFENIYKHFFQVDSDEDETEDEDENTNIEGFQTTTPPPRQEITISKEDPKLLESQSPETKAIAQVQSVDYKSDNQLNPLLKQTIKRIVSIDSQYRNNKQKSLSTDFTFNLSDPLKDVLSMKLYSVNIPLSWYTINNSYGSNFFYLKGITDGITNGNHDYKIEISSGNYTNKELVAAINTQMQKLSTTYTDVSFGNTKLEYNETLVKSTFTIDIQKVYNETDYSIQFPNSIDVSNVSNVNSLNSFLGFDSIMTDSSLNSTYSYIPYSITSIINNENTTNYDVNDRNNTFNVIQYLPDVINDINNYNNNNEYNGNNILKTIPITISNNFYTTTTLVNAINSAIRSNPYLDSISCITSTPSTNNTLLVKLKIKLNRLKVMYQLNSNIVLQFPNDTKIWTGNNSCLKFKTYQIANDNTYYAEMNNIVSNIAQEKRGYDITSNSALYLECIGPSADFSNNSLNSYLIPYPASTNNQINTLINTLNTNSSQFFTQNGLLQSTDLAQPGIYFYKNANNYFNSKINIYKNYDETNYEITSLNSKLQLYDVSRNTNIALPYDLSNNVFYMSIIENFGIYVFNTTDFMKIKGKSTLGTSSITYDLSFSSLQFYSYTDIISDINTQFANYSYYGKKVLENSSISYYKTIAENPDNKIIFKLEINVNYILTSNNYRAHFIADLNTDYNTWSRLYTNTNHPISQSILNRIGQTYVNSYDISYSLIDYTPNYILNGQQIITSLLNVTDTQNNTFCINLENDEIRGYDASSNIVVFTIQPNPDYSIDRLLNTMNELLTQNPLTYGSYLYLITIDTNQYVKIRLNINKVFTTKDYKLVFYDTYSFVKCFVGAKSVRNTTWDTTIGWILGYRNYTEYNMRSEYQYINSDGKVYYIDTTNGLYSYANTMQYGNEVKTTITLESDTATNTNVYNYFMIILDDYTQNHLNDGLVSITPLDTNIAGLGTSYAYYSKQICDPVTGEKVQSSSITSQNKLTANQIYALNQITNSKNNKPKSYSLGPATQDIFGVIPIKPGAAGSTYVEFGGTLQNQERLYFGPVNIHRMNVKLVNDKGDVVDLNGGDWSISLICEQLYTTKI